MKTGLFPGFFPHGKYTKNGGKIFVEKHGKKTGDETSPVSKIKETDIHVHGL